MELELGSNVVSSDGEDVGKVDRLVVDPETREVSEIIIHKGFFLTEDRVVPMTSIRGVDNDGTVRLGVSAHDIDQLPLFVERAYYIPTEEEYSTLPYMGANSVIAPGLAAPLLWGAPPAGRPMLDPAVPVDAQAEAVPQSTLSDEVITIDKGTNVLDRNGESVGHVEEVNYDSQGKMTSIVVKTGIIRRHEYLVPTDWVDKFLETEVWLNVPESELVEIQN